MISLLHEGKCPTLPPSGEVGQNQRGADTALHTECRYKLSQLYLSWPSWERVQFRTPSSLEQELLLNTDEPWADQMPRL